MKKIKDLKIGDYIYVNDISTGDVDKVSITNIIKSSKYFGNNISNMLYFFVKYRNKEVSFMKHEKSNCSKIIKGDYVIILNYEEFKKYNDILKITIKNMKRFDPLHIKIKSILNE